MVIGVGDIKKAMERVASAGGTVLGEPMTIPGIGQYVSFTDTEGNRVSLLEPAPMAKPARAKPAASQKKAAAKKKVAAKKKDDDRRVLAEALRLPSDAPTGQVRPESAPVVKVLSGPLPNESVWTPKAWAIETRANGCWHPPRISGRAACTNRWEERNLASLATAART